MLVASLLLAASLALPQTPDYMTNGDVYYFDASGKQIDKFDSQGLNPQKCLLLAK